MILDNADNDGILFESLLVQLLWGGETRSYERLLIDFIPQAPHGRILVTSRQRRCVRRIVGNDFNLIKVNPMTENESFKLLRSRVAGVTTDVGSAWAERELLSSLEYIPLAISQAGAYISNSESSAEDYLRLLEANDHSAIRMLQQDEGDLRREQKPSDLPADDERKAPHAVLNTWLISFRQIESRFPAAATSLSSIVFFHWQGIPQHALHEEGDDSAFQLALAPLLDYDLVKKGQNKVIGMHRLVQVTTRGYLAFKGTIEIFRVDALKRMVQHFPQGCYENWSRCRQLYPHVEEVMLNQKDFNKCGVDYGKLQHRLGKYYFSRGNLDMAASHAVGAVKMKLKILASDDVEVLESKLFLASMTGEVGNWSATEEILLEVIDIVRSHPRDPKYLILLPGIAMDYANVLICLGHHQDAEKTAVMAKDAATRCYGSDSPTERAALAQLANAYKRTGRLREAEEILFKLHESQKAHLPADHPNRCLGLLSLTVLRHLMGKWDVAQESFKEALEGLERVLGENHVHVLS